MTNEAENPKGLRNASVLERELMDINNKQGAEIKALRKQKDGAYTERNQCVALLAKCFPSWLERHDENDKEWEDDWRNIVFIDLPTGQASWHIHDSEMSLFEGLARLSIHSWDGHTTEEKYARMARVQAHEIQKQLKTEMLDLMKFSMESMAKHTREQRRRAEVAERALLKRAEDFERSWMEPRPAKGIFDTWLAQAAAELEKEKNNVSNL